MSDSAQPNRPPAGPRRPNVLLVTFDQWRADHLGALGCPLPITPNVDRLAAEGVAFANHYAQCAPCGPSRASLLTGRYLMNHRSVNNGTPLDRGIRNLAQEMRDLGYDPTLFGYTDTTIDPRGVDPDDPRLTIYEGVMDGFTVGVNVPESGQAWLDWMRDRGLDFADVWEAFGVAGADEPDAAHRFGPAPFPAELSGSAYLTEQVIDFVRGATDDPWCAHVTYLSPHPPFVAPAPFCDLVSPADVAPPRRHDNIEETSALHPLLWAMLAVPSLTAPDDAVLAQLRATYANMIAEVDHQFGRLLDELERLGIADDTIVICTSDHGEQLGDHRLMHKLGFFDESFHIPLVIRYPRAVVNPGRVETRFTENIDLLPTILDLVADDIPAYADGASLLPILADRPVPNWRTEAHYEWDPRDPSANLLGAAFGIRLDESPLCVARSADTHYVHFAADSVFPPLLFDLASDPDCLIDRANDPGFAPRALDAARRMLSWRMRHNGGELVNTIATPSGMVSASDPPRP